MPDHDSPGAVCQEDDPLLHPDRSTGRLRKQDVYLIGMMFVVNYCNFVCFSLIAPFFPKEVVTKGGTQALASWIFGCYQLVVFLVCPQVGKHVSHLGTTFLFVAGTFVTGTACALFGLLSMVEDFHAFIALAFAIRIVEGVGAGAYLTASFCIAATEYPARMAFVQGLLETASGLGLSTGPTIGGALYTAGGYWMPFAVVGSILVITGLLSTFALQMHSRSRNDSRAHRKVINHASGSLWDLLRIPDVLVSGMTIVCGAMSIGFYEPSLELHIDKFLSSPFEVGLVFLASAGSYALFSPLWGAAADRMKQPKNLMICGSCIVSTALVLMGPAPFLGVKTKLWIVILALLLHGIGVGGQLVPPLRDMLTAALRNGFRDDVNTHGLGSGLFASAFSLGAFLGPLIGGSLIDVISFEWSAFLISCINASVAVILLMIVFLRHRAAHNCQSANNF
ncbi:MFS-type transporter SLC18B1-like [Paramacrobiotus metropolitanus]|uniref:MFS-type transporter SLC18B1-like n=1 Tax=Paramacrobiotus metropolitanus TaxID=2943436 RepID=UPI00244583A9|nr:MFS-type transporter SLC18B1-like [Paramacrobiotus metropolitanus]